MNIAVACDGLGVAPYFAQTTSYMCYNVEKGIIVDCKNMPAFDQTLDKLVELLKSVEIDTIVVGRIEYDVASVMCRAGIEVVAGAEGESLDVVRAYVSKTLAGISEPCSIGASVPIDDVDDGFPDEDDDFPYDDEGPAASANAE